MPSPLPLRCSFCGFGNAADAKYCNDCGSPLHLQPCNHCGAVHERKATHCHQCGEAFGTVAAPGRADAESGAGMTAAEPDSKTLASTPAPAFPGVAMPNALPGSRTDTFGSGKESTRAPLVELAAPGLDAFFQGLWTSTGKAAKPVAQRTLSRPIADAREQAPAIMQEPAQEAREPAGEVLRLQSASVAIAGEIATTGEQPRAQDPARSLEPARGEEPSTLSSRAEPESGAAPAPESTGVGASPVADAPPVPEDAASANLPATPGASRRKSRALGVLIALAVAALGVYFFASSPRPPDPQSASTRGAITSGAPASPTASPSVATVSSKPTAGSPETMPYSKAPAAAVDSTGQAPLATNDSIPLAQSASVTAHGRTGTAPDPAMPSAASARVLADPSRDVARADPGARGSVLAVPKAPKRDGRTSATAARASSAAGTEAKPRLPAPVPAECTDGVAALGLCSPNAN